MPGDHLLGAKLRLREDLHSAAAALWDALPFLPPPLPGSAALWARGDAHLPLRRLPAVLSSGGEGMHRRPRRSEEHPLRIQRHPLQPALREDPPMWDARLRKDVPSYAL